MAADTREGNSSILSMLRKVGLSSFTLDSPTPGNGSCFMIAILQQVRRNSKCYPSRLQALAANLDHYGLRVEVKKYVNSCEHPVIQDWKERFRNVTDLEWNYYWSENWMLKMKRGRGQWTWADEPYISVYCMVSEKRLNDCK